MGRPYSRLEREKQSACRFELEDLPLKRPRNLPDKNFLSTLTVCFCVESSVAAIQFKKRRSAVSGSCRQSALRLRVEGQKYDVQYHTTSRNRMLFSKVEFARNQFHEVVQKSPGLKLCPLRSICGI